MAKVHKIKTPLDVPVSTGDVSHGLPIIMPGIEISKALKRINNNHKLLRSILLEFYRDFSSAGEVIRKFLHGKRQSDQASAQLLAHSIRGMAGNFSASKLSEAAGNLEKGIKQNERETWPYLLEDFENHLGQVMASIKTMQDAEESMPTEVNEPPLVVAQVDQAMVTPLLQRLSICLQDANFEAVDVFEEVKQLLVGAKTGVLEEMKRLSGHIDRLDFKPAYVSLIAMTEQLGFPLKVDTK